LFVGLANNESAPGINNFRGCVFGIERTESVRVVGNDDEPILGTISDNPNASGTQYTLFEAENGTGNFITNNVRAGDIVRYQYTADGYDNPVYTSYTVDQVLSEDSLILLTGPGTSIVTPQKVEIWHTNSTDEIVADLQGKAQAFADRRVVVCWPDRPKNAGVTETGYYVAAAIAGQISGVAPHQGLTNAELAGFDDMSASYALFTDEQLNDLASSGIWIVTEDEDGTIHTRHALTTDTTDINLREEMVRRNVDNMSGLVVARFQAFIGRANVSPKLIGRLNYEVQALHDQFTDSTLFTDELGPQLIAGTRLKIVQNPLLKDTVDVVLGWLVPAPNNYTLVNLQIS
jgi:hypothetical protein